MNRKQFEVGLLCFTTFCIGVATTILLLLANGSLSPINECEHWPKEMPERTTPQVRTVDTDINHLYFLNRI